MSNITTSTRAGTKNGSGLWIKKNRRLLLTIALILFFSFPVIYLIIKTSSAATTLQTPPVRQSPDVAAMERIAVVQPTTENFTNLSLVYFRAGHLTI